MPMYWNAGVGVSRWLPAVLAAFSKAKRLCSSQKPLGPILYIGLLAQRSPLALRMQQWAGSLLIVLVRLTKISCLRFYSKKEGKSRKGGPRGSARKGCTTVSAPVLVTRCRTTLPPSLPLTQAARWTFSGLDGLGFAPCARGGGARLL